MRPLRQHHKHSAPLVGLTAPPICKPLHTISCNQPHKHPKIITQPLRDDEHWEFLENRRQSHLNALFNRRKTMLESISKKNRQIYQRIQNQESNYHQLKLQKKYQKTTTIQNLTQGSRILLALSKHAMARSKMQAQSTVRTINKQNCQPQRLKMKTEERKSKRGSQLCTIEELPRVRVIQSRLIETGRLYPVKSQQLECHAKIRACSVGRRKMQDVFINF